jgi:putative ABC transport system ATP-binding protein
MSLIAVTGLGKRYRMGEMDIDALVDVTLAIEAGEAVAVMGPSGSGKSTLLNLMSCLDQPSSGSYLLGGEDVSRLSRARLAMFRNRHVGLIFQGFNLLARATARENVELPLIYAGCRAAVRRKRALELLDSVGLSDRANHLPSQLSGGQQQRVAIARALVNRPEVLLADEPTGSLDSQSSTGIQELLAEINASGVTLVIVTHDPTVAGTMRRVLTLRDGRLMSDLRANEASALQASAAA